MAPWFIDKISEITDSPLTSEQCRLNKELAESVFTKHFPPLEFSSGRIPQFLLTESLATSEWLSASLRSNTGHDRIFAMAYLVNLRPMNCMRYLNSLISMINPAKQRDCIRAIDVLHQLFDNSLIPKHRTMHSFNSRPISLDSITTNSLEKEKILCLWLFEEQLKASFCQFVKALERLLLIDTVESFKRKALSTLSQLVLKLPENRSLILSIIINKLGDRSKVLASAVIHHLKKLVGVKRTLTDLVVQEIRAFLFRPNLLERAKYYALVFLSCLELHGTQSRPLNSSGSSATALTLVRIYSTFFHSAVQSKEISEKLVSTLLTGLSRAAPFIPATQFDELLNEINDIFRLVHTSTFNVSLQALCVLFQLSTHKPDFRNRYYQALYRKLRDPQILNTSRGPSVLHLVYRSLLVDVDPERIAAFVQRLLQLCLYHPSPGFVVGTLILLSKVNAQKNSLITTTQTAVLSEEFKDPAPAVSEDENFSDAVESEAECPIVQTSTDSKQRSIGNLVESWHHRRLADVKQDGSGVQSDSHPDRYRPNAREPMFARAAGHPSWPLVSLTAHCHPTVSLFANMLLQGKPIAYTGNPFDDFALLHFLDRFAFKKPKATKKSGKSAPPCRRLQRRSTVNSGSRAFAINSALFRQLSSDKVAADELFFHNYAKFLETRVSSKGETGTSRDSDDSVSDTEFDSYLEKYEKGLIPPGVDSADDDDVDFDKADFSDDDLADQAMSDNSDDQNAFAEMDGITPGMLEPESCSFLDKQHMDVDLDTFTEELVDRKIKKRKSKSSPSNLSELFASAEEVGRLFNLHESSTQRKRRLWEEKNAIKPKHEKCLAQRNRRKSGHTKKSFAHSSSARRRIKHKCGF